MNRHAWCCALILLIVSAAAADPTATTSTLSDPTAATLATNARDALLDDLARDAEAVRCFRLAFTQTRHLTFFDAPLVSHGVCAFQKPDRFRWEVRRPFGSLLILNGRHAGRFAIEDGAARRLRGDADRIALLLGQIVQWMRGDFRTQDDRFTIEARRGRFAHVVLTPSRTALRDWVECIDIVFERDTRRAAGFVIHEPEGDRIEVRFHDVRENVALDDALFDLNAPALEDDR